MEIFVADTRYFSEDLEKEFYIENKRILFVKSKASMKKMIIDGYFAKYIHSILSYVLR